MVLFYTISNEKASNCKGLRAFYNFVVLNGIQEVSGSIPLISTKGDGSNRRLFPILESEERL